MSFLSERAGDSERLPGPGDCLRGREDHLQRGEARWRQRADAAEGQPAAEFRIEAVEGCFQLPRIGLGDQHCHIGGHPVVHLSVEGNIHSHRPERFGEPRLHAGPAGGPARP